MKILNLFFLVLLCSCNYSEKIKTPSKRVPIFIITDHIKQRKVEIDEYIKKHQKDFIVLVKIPGKNKLVAVDNQNWPDKVEYTYDVLKDDLGKIILITTHPFSESGDWELECRHYFNLEGNTIAYEKQSRAFVLPNDGVAVETITDYFDSKFKPIKHDYHLVDKDNKKLNKKQYGFDYEGVDTVIYSNVNQCLKAYNIKL